MKACDIEWETGRYLPEFRGGLHYAQARTGRMTRFRCFVRASDAFDQAMMAQEELLRDGLAQRSSAQAASGPA